MRSRRHSQVRHTGSPSAGYRIRGVGTKAGQYSRTGQVGGQLAPYMLVKAWAIVVEQVLIPDPLLPPSSQQELEHAAAHALAGRTVLTKARRCGDFGWDQKIRGKGVAPTVARTCLTCGHCSRPQHALRDKQLGEQALVSPPEPTGKPAPLLRR